MPSQTDFDRVQRCIIDPMKRHWDAQFDAATVGDFVDDLARFDEKTLVKAMEKIRHEHKRKPALAHVYEACKEAKGSGGNTAPVSLPWQERQNRRRQLIEEYLARFTNASSMWPEAVRGGWDFHLLRYVEAVASVQAQIIIPEMSGIAWDGVIIFGPNGVSKDDQHRFFADQRRLCAHGVIDVPIPTGRIDDWKGDVAQHKKRLAADKPAKKKIMPANQKLDEYIAKAQAGA